MGLSGTAAATAPAHHAPVASGAPAPPSAEASQVKQNKIPSPANTNPEESVSQPDDNANILDKRTTVLTPESLPEQDTAVGHRARLQGLQSQSPSPVPIMPPSHHQQQQPLLVRPSDLSPYTTSSHEHQRRNGQAQVRLDTELASGAAQAQPPPQPATPQSHSERRVETNGAADSPTAAAVKPSSPWSAAPEPWTASSPTSPTSLLTQAFPPLYTSNVLPGTHIVHPKPINLPVSGTSTPLPTKPHATSNPRRPEQSIRNSAFVGNVAQLEATAERLSTGTSSIGDAIHALHGELKRSDSRRSSILAATLRAQNDDTQTQAEAPAVGQLKRHLSNSSSIVATNSAARHGGYSPSAFVMSPTHSMTGRLRSGSKNSSGQPDFSSETGLARHGPGKASVRSVRSTRRSLAEISESEPTALNKDALDAADAAPPIDDDDDDDNEHDDTLQPDDVQPPAASGTEAFHQMLGQSADATAGQLAGTVQRQPSHAARPARSNSVNTFQQAQEAFIDFDGTHCEAEPDPEPQIYHQHEQHHIHFEEPMNLDFSMPHEQEFPTTHISPNEMPRPQSYFNHETGQQMLYYPARVPAMINLPPKLSTKPKVGQHHDRRSKVLNAMDHSNKHSEDMEAKRKSGMPEFSRDSWLPDPLAGHRGSFIALSQENLPADETRFEAHAQPESPSLSEPAQLRKPQRLSRTEPENHQRASSHLPPQLRASAYFDLPSNAPEVEVKDGSAMATLDSMLDASTTAPVSAFTNHSFAGGLGAEVYGKEKKHKSKVSTSSLKPEDANKKEKRASRSWFKRGSSYKGEERAASNSRSRSPSALGDVHGETDVPETQGLASDIDGRSVQHPEDAESDSEEDSEYNGQPTTLLAELQLRKQQQKQRTAPRVNGQGSHMTLMEMDAVAETQRKHRQNKRVNLAWEDPNAHLDQNGSDDDDVPLAILAAKHAGAKNMADLERPIGLMERREIEDNEPLSHRRARLQGQPTPMTLGIPKRQSIAGLSTHLGAGHVRTPSTQPPRSQAVTPEPAEPEIEQETLGERKKRLEARDLPRARPVSSSFSAELLSQFGDLDDAKSKANDKPKTRLPQAEEEEEETLGQRRRRLQAEKEAREREMSYNNLTGAPAVNRRLSMADMLAAHPHKGIDNRAQQARQRAEQEQFASQARDAMMAGMRMQMPQTLQPPGMNRAGGYGGGIYNDSFGGQAVQSTSALNTQGVVHVPRQNRSTTALSAYGMPMQQQGGYAPSQYGGMSNMGGMNGPYGRASMQMPMQMQMEAPPQVNVNSMKRIDQWRHGVMP